MHKPVIQPTHGFNVPRLRTRLPREALSETITNIYLDGGKPEHIDRLRKLLDGSSGHLEARKTVEIIRARGDICYWECDFLSKELLDMYIIVILAEKSIDLLLEGRIISLLLLLSAAQGIAATEIELFLQIHLKTCRKCSNKKREIEEKAVEFIEKLQDPKSTFFDTEEIPEGAFNKLFNIRVELLNETPEHVTNATIANYMRILRKDKFRSGTKRRIQDLKVDLAKIKPFSVQHPELRSVRCSLSPGALKDIDVTSAEAVRSHKESLLKQGYNLLDRAGALELLELMQLPAELMILLPQLFLAD